MKSNKGMGYIQVIIIIAFIAMLVASSIYYVRMKLNEEYIETIKTNMLLIEWRVREYKDKKKAEGEEITYIGTKVSDVLEDPLIIPILEKNVISSDEYDNYYVLKDSDLEALSLEITNEENSYYIIDYETLDIIITKGCSYKDDQTLYRLSDIKNGYESNMEENVIENITYMEDNENIEEE